MLTYMSQVKFATAIYSNEESTDPVSVRVSLEAKAELQKIADAEKRTLSQLVAVIIDDFLKEQAGKKR